MAESATKITPEFLYLLSGDQEDFLAALEDLRAADVAEAINALPLDAAGRVVTALPFHMLVQILDEPELERRGELFEGLDEGLVAQLVEALSADSQVELYRDLTLEARARLLHLLPAPTRDTIRTLMAYPPTSAGGLMTTEFVGVPSTWTADEVRKHVAEVGHAKETVYAIYVLEAGTNVLERVVSLREIISVSGTTKVDDIGDDRDPLTVGPLIDREDVARLIAKYNLLAVPVVDDRQRMLGIVTVDDILDAMISEQTEDVQKFGGMEVIEEPYLHAGFAELLKKRAGWLAILFVGETLTAQAMQHFENGIAAVTVIGMFVPLIISSGGNSGSQATSLIIRAMAIKEVTLADWWRVLLRELPTGLSLGAMLGGIGFVRIMLWQFMADHHWSIMGLHLGYDYSTHVSSVFLLALTIFFALVGVVLFGSFAGSMLPFILRRFKLDPASASAPLVATLVDVTGLVIYFTVALLLLEGTILAPK